VSTGLWLSRLRLNPRHADSARALRDAQALHALTMRCLPPDMGRAEANLLHHADLAAGMLMVQSTIRPQWPETPAFEAQAKEITAFMGSLGRGDTLRFAVRAVPMRRQSASLRDGTPMKEPGEHALRTDDERIFWLGDRLGAAGRLTGFPLISAEPDRVGYRKGDRFLHRPTLFEGAIEVLDEEALWGLATRGIGRAKAYGNGLLILARPPAR